MAGRIYKVDVQALSANIQIQNTLWYEQGTENPPAYGGETGMVALAKKLWDTWGAVWLAAHTPQYNMTNIHVTAFDGSSGAPVDIAPADYAASGYGSTNGNTSSGVLSVPLKFVLGAGYNLWPGGPTSFFRRSYLAFGPAFDEGIDADGSVNGTYMPLLENVAGALKATVDMEGVATTPLRVRVGTNDAGVTVLHRYATIINCVPGAKTGTRRSRLA